MAILELPVSKAKSQSPVRYASDLVLADDSTTELFAFEGAGRLNWLGFYSAYMSSVTIEIIIDGISSGEYDFGVLTTSALAIKEYMTGVNKGMLDFYAEFKSSCVINAKVESLGATCTFNSVTNASLY